MKLNILSEKLRYHKMLLLDFAKFSTNKLFLIQRDKIRLVKKILISFQLLAMKRRNLDLNTNSRKCILNR